ncbi:hypothetical protein [Accumulibacter sp.]|uniref:hypothetical protein n=1 Tax=Accumulibacter sp. TaxID=2053492 RepID=UPI0025FA044C|nr:hypothetical protein [Accumulibacter sp.]MCM8595136.1 hypothetical protein [Accumulibacter sp.]MCM8625522.1 hypothetical protein [Accumulibacter sp.]MDS4049282.1 hypothetical protein [Accumulibacter sp.]
MAGPSDPLGWARQPRSQLALDSAFKLAERNRELRAIVKALVGQGISTADGKLLRQWDGTQWLPARRAVQ